MKKLLAVLIVVIVVSGMVLAAGGNRNSSSAQNVQAYMGRGVQGAENNGVCTEECEDCGLTPQDGTGNQYGYSQATKGNGTRMNAQTVTGRGVQGVGNNGVCTEECEDCGLTSQDGTGNQFGRNQ